MLHWGGGGASCVRKKIQTKRADENIQMQVHEKHLRLQWAVIFTACNPERAGSLSVVLSAQPAGLRWGCGCWTVPVPQSGTAACPGTKAKPKLDSLNSHLPDALLTATQARIKLAHSYRWHGLENWMIRHRAPTRSWESGSTASVCVNGHTRTGIRQGRLSENNQPENPLVRHDDSNAHTPAAMGLVSGFSEPQECQSCRRISKLPTQCRVQPSPCRHMKCSQSSVQSVFSLYLVQMPAWRNPGRSRHQRHGPLAASGTMCGCVRCWELGGGGFHCLSLIWS